ncbi:MAG TPA: hypothetical protein VFS59_06220 [Gemmatimonadaceae bacterium]|nr:hypothetical protein [Gemmatimonadaceae bacterium]
MRIARALAIAIAELSLSACGWDCGTAARTVATGTVRDAAGSTLATATVDLSDNVGPSFLRLSVGVMAPGGSAGAPLKGRVTRARLVSESGELIAEIPTSTETLYLDVVVALNVDVSRAEYNRIRAALFSSRTRIILETDLPGRELIETVMQDVRDVPSEVGRCSPQ